MGKLLGRLLQMSKSPGMYIGHESTWAIWNYVAGYYAAAADAGTPCDDLRGFDEWVNLRMLLPPGSTDWSARLTVAAATSHLRTYPHARNTEQRACWLFFEWLKEFAVECDARGVDTIIAEHDNFVWPELLEEYDESE